jgi:hypothetical protein
MYPSVITQLLWRNASAQRAVAIVGRKNHRSDCSCLYMSFVMITQARDGDGTDVRAYFMDRIKSVHRDRRTKWATTALSAVFLKRAVDTFASGKSSGPAVRAFEISVT